MSSGYFPIRRDELPELVRTKLAEPHPTWDWWRSNGWAIFRLERDGREVRIVARIVLEQAEGQANGTRPCIHIEGEREIIGPEHVVARTGDPLPADS